jgi:AcrR family transcriptional regulator
LAKTSGTHVTRADIEQAAARVFRREGYRPATMSQIAEEVGLHKTSLYHHIKSKQDLLVSLSQYVMVEPIQQLDAIANDRTKPPRERLYEAVLYYMNRVFTSTDAIAVFDLYAGDIQDEGVRESIQNMKRRYIKIFVNLVAECLGPESEEKASLVTYAILGMCSYVVTWYRPGETDQTDTVAHTFARAALRAVDPRPVFTPGSGDQPVA